MDGFYVVGTSSKVGTTTTSVALIRALMNRGLRVAAFKPVEVGCSIAAGGGEIDGIPGGELSSEARSAFARLNELVGPPSIAVSTKTAPEALQARDAERLASALGDGASPEAINRFRYSPLVSPAMAARLAERPMTLEGLCALARAAAEGGELLVVDGSGGLMEPFGDALLQRDLVVALQLPVLLVADTEGESINQVLLNLEVLRLAELKVAGVVLHRKQRRPRPEEAAVPLMIEAVEGDIVRGVFPCFEEEQVNDPRLLGERFAIHVDVDALLSAEP